MPLIKHRTVSEDTWVTLPEGAAIPPTGDILVTLKTWNTERAALQGRQGQVGVWLAPEDAPEQLEALEQLTVIAVAFPKFSDGRGYSAARLLRDRLQYRGELRAIGDVLSDQLFYMMRCGFDAFALKDGKSLDAALAAFEAFSVSYQSAADGRTPVRDRRAAKLPPP
jgi:uncharacterized protein (DUF934 family)